MASTVHILKDTIDIAAHFGNVYPVEIDDFSLLVCKYCYC